jgi:hypothetical protein
MGKPRGNIIVRFRARNKVIARFCPRYDLIVCIQSLEVKGAAMLGICKNFAGTWRVGARGPSMYVALG